MKGIITSLKSTLKLVSVNFLDGVDGRTHRDVHFVIMAEAAKRSKLDNDIEIYVEKDNKLDTFLKWLDKEGVEISDKVCPEI